MENATKEKRESMLSRLNGDKVIWTVVFLLSLISIALIYSSSSSLAYKEKTTNFAFLIKQIQFVSHLDNHVPHRRIAEFAMAEV